MRLALLIALAGVVGAQDLVNTLDAPHGDPGDSFGASVAISGDRVLVGAPYEGPHYRGRAYLYRRTDGALAKGLKADDWEKHDHFGHRVAMGGGVVVIGANSNDYGLVSGSVYVYDQATGDLKFKLHAPHPRPFDFFGKAVAADAGMIAVSAIGKAVDGKSFAGKIYVFSAGDGQLFRTLTMPNPRAGARLGWHLAMHGQRIAAWADWDGNTNNLGEVHVFDALLGQHRYRLRAFDRNEGDSFGTALAMSDDRLMVAAPGYDAGSSHDRGKVYVYDLIAGHLLMTLEPPQPYEFGDGFGTGVAFADELMVVSSPGHDLNLQNLGRVYVFDPLGNPIDQISGRVEGARFGQHIAADGHRLVVGMPHSDEHGQNQGAAELYCLSGEIGLNYCGPANLHSGGVSGEIRLEGSLDMDCSDMHVFMNEVPPYSPCLLLASQYTGFWSVGNGHVCLSNPMGIFSKDMTIAGPNGAAVLRIALDELPDPLHGAFTPGDTWHFQAMFRDDTVGTVNFTDAISVTLH